MMDADDRLPMEDFRDRVREDANMSDEALARLMAGAEAPAQPGSSPQDLEPGTKVKGRVLEIQRDELLVELDRKTLGVIDLAGFGDEAPPPPGSPIEAEFVRYDRKKELCILSIGALRTDVAWEDLRPGQIVEGKVIEAVKGGLVLDLKGMRAFMPISQVELERIESLEPYVGEKLRCEVQEVSRSERNIVVSRRAVLEKERAIAKVEAFKRVAVGQVLTGRVVRLTEHGAFVNLGAFDGLLHASKMRYAKSPIAVGQTIEVEVIQVDPDRGRVGLDLRQEAADTWDSDIEGYGAGEIVTGWISRVGPEGAILSMGQGVQAFMPAAMGGKDLRPGAVVKATIVSIDKAARRIVVRPS